VLYSCSIDGVLRATDLRSQGSQHTWQAKAGTELTTLALHPDGATLIAGTDSGGLLSFALNAEGLLEGEPKTIPGGTEAISGLTISPRGHEYVVADKANALTGRDWSDGRELWNRKTGNPLQALHYDATGYHLSFVDPLGFGFGIMLSYRMQPENFLHLHDNAVRRAFILRRGFLTASYDGSLRIWGREASRPLSLWASGQSEFGPLMDAELLPGESRVLAAYQDGSVRLWEIFEPAERAFFGSGNQTICIVGNRHEAFDGSGLFDLEGKKPPMLVDAADRHATAVWGVAASSDGQRMASCDHDGRVKVWDPVSRKAIATFRETEELVWCVAFRPNSSWLAGGFDKIAIWDTDRRELLMMLDGHKGLVASLVFHPKLPLLVSAGRDRFIRIWHLESKTLLAEYGPMETFANSVTFDPAGQWLAAGCEDGEVRLWKMESLEQARAYGPPKRTFSGHTSPVRAVAFSHNGLLASGAEQGIVLLRDADHDFRRLVRLQSGAGQIRSLQFSRDDRFLACGYYVSPGVAWDLPAVRKALAAVDLDW
jgi:WD40 repeat protein